MPKRSHSTLSLPRELIIFENADKKFHEKWTPDRSPASFPHPFRAVLCGPPNSGKSMYIKNIILHANPPFQACYLLYPGEGKLSDRTDEWSDVENLEILEEVPPPSFFKKAGDDKAKKTLVICDDMDLKALPKAQRSNLDRLYGTVSTHRHVSVISTSQDWFSLPTVCRRLSNVWVVWKHKDRLSMEMISKRCSEDLAALFREICTNHHDSICIDLTNGTPYPLRLNLFTKIFKREE